jgi:hypothetical protein
MQFCPMFTFSSCNTIANRSLLHVCDIGSRVDMHSRTARRRIAVMTSKEGRRKLAIIQNFPCEPMSKDTRPSFFSLFPNRSITRLRSCSMPRPTAIHAVKAMLTDFNTLPKSLQERFVAPIALHRTVFATPQGNFGRPNRKQASTRLAYALIRHRNLPSCSHASVRQPVGNWRSVASLAGQVEDTRPQVYTISPVFSIRYGMVA